MNFKISKTYLLALSIFFSSSIELKANSEEINELKSSNKIFVHFLDRINNYVPLYGNKATYIMMNRFLQSQSIYDLKKSYSDYLSTHNNQVENEAENAFNPNFGELIVKNLQPIRELARKHFLKDLSIDDNLVLLEPFSPGLDGFYSAGMVNYDRGVYFITNQAQKIFAFAHELGHAYGPTLRKENNLRVLLVANKSRSTVEEYAADLFAVYMVWKLTPLISREIAMLDVIQYIKTIQPETTSLPGVPLRGSVVEQAFKTMNYLTTKKKLNSEIAFMQIYRAYFSDQSPYVEAIDAFNKANP